MSSPLGARPAGLRGLVKDVLFIDPKIGWTLGMREVPGQPSAEPIRYRIAGEHSLYIPVLFRTEDGGRTWTQQRYPDLKSLPHHLAFADKDHGLSIELNATLFTRDGGISWHRSQYCSGVNTSNLREAALGSGTFEATTAQLFDSNLGWWSVEGDVFHTTDGGATWCQLPSIQWHGGVLRISHIQFGDAELGWAIPTIGEQWPRPPPCFETHDGGRTWKPISAPASVRIDGMAASKDGAPYFWGYDYLYKLVR
jgi:photosystem II stability/assembly factor-like uncharacterized protein